MTRNFVNNYQETQSFSSKNAARGWASFSPELAKELSKLSDERREVLKRAGGNVAAFLAENLQNLPDLENYFTDKNAENSLQKTADAVAPEVSLFMLGGPLAVVPMAVTAETILSKKPDQQNCK